MKLAGILGGLGVILVGCGGFVYTTVGGTVTGLGTSGTNLLVLKNDQNYTQTLTTDGTYAFNVASNGSYTISVATQPNLVNCTIANASGKMTGSGSVTNVAVTCVPNVEITGTATGITTGGVLTLNNNVTNVVGAVNTNNQTTVSANGTFYFPTYVVSGNTYNVTVQSPPVNQYCFVSNGTGVADINNPGAATTVAVNCVAGVPLKFTVNGLTAGNALIMADTNTDKVDKMTVSTIGIYNFPWNLLPGMRYSVTVDTQPTGQTCTVQNGTGVADLSNPAGASNIVVNCV
jgi:hypothetical protein